jgi:ACS family hexuronate transporter-like MFS transporter
MTKLPVNNLRWYIAVLLCFASELNYLDRQTLSVLAQTIQKELNLTTVDYSYITSSFLVSYTIMYAVSGRLVDYLGARRSFIFFVSGWSIANMLHAFANTALAMSFFRFLLGAAEPGNFPAGIKAVSEWFPMRERALAVGIFNGGTALGSALAAPLISIIALTWGWRSAFIITGLLGLIWVGVWAHFYRSPENHPRLSHNEKELILSDHEREDDPGVKPVTLRQLLTARETWGCIAARVLIDPASYFLTFWIPKYLQQERGFSLGDIGKYAWIPFLALALGNIAGGAVPRFLISRGWTLNSARKSTMLAVSCLIPVFYLLVTRVDSQNLALFLISGLMFGHAAWGNITLPVEVFPKSVVGTVSGIGGALGGITGIASQIGIGQVVENFSYAPVFAVCSGLYLLAFIVVSLLIGKLGIIRHFPITGPTATQAP